MSDGYKMKDLHYELVKTVMFNRVDACDLRAAQASREETAK
jgi:hypothetical protein